MNQKIGFSQTNSGNKNVHVCWGASKLAQKPWLSKTNNTKNVHVVFGSEYDLKEGDLVKRLNNCTAFDYKEGKEKDFLPERASQSKAVTTPSIQWKGIRFL